MKEDFRSKILDKFNIEFNFKKRLIKSKIIIDLLEFYNIYTELYSYLFDLTSLDMISGVGKGEILIYFLYDDVELSGFKSGADIHINGINQFEIKSVKSSKLYYYDFRLGIESKDANREFIGNLKILCGAYKECLQRGPDIINWEEIPARVLEYIDSFGDINELYKKNGRFRLNFTIDENFNVIIDDDKLGKISDLNTLELILYKYKQKKTSSVTQKEVLLSNLTKIKREFIKKIASNSKYPILLFDNKKKVPIGFFKLNTKNIEVLRVTNGHVRIGILKNES